ncbi:MAG: DUF423 domain-containing protein [Salegentibacter sp.]|uniref:Uncharacterized membrane protein YgdD, TMEM256/DUF423 family n=1 Tax=Salegentibacter flavus TaxID=287099 RepID=A0A1I5ARK9_9FLAO|nr:MULTISPECIES: DUF423 domain-containing protein [Salegentibacter]MDR9456671.1 DUF423 domain-containing protein [Salegentibacter sp.]SFN65081.1 Uncharacterized membrane protein YgdD, TMEM256/DUF423 family [Salegentibacter flavus]
MDKRFLVAGSIFGLLGVIIGAFATHGLNPLLEESSLKSFETGVKYQIYHAFLLLIIGGFKIQGLKKLTSVFYLVVAGVLLFSGSIYLLATNDLTSFDFKSIALITPVGGTLLILAWLILGVKFISLKNE